MDHPYHWLKYMPAGELEGQGGAFKGFKVESSSGETLGKVEGFVIDSESVRPYYFVVDAGGWFKSKHYLLPVGLAGYDSAHALFLTDRLTREQIKRYPGFDLSRFESMSMSELKRFNEETLQACTITGVVFTYAEVDPLAAAWDQPEFAYPDWWRQDKAEQPYASSSSSATKSGSRDRAGK